MVKKFRGKVKVSDVQHEFDVLLNRINTLNQRIIDVQNIDGAVDYSEGSSNLAAAGYTLTVGGLKKALNGLDGAIIGAKAFKTDGTHFKMTNGYLISKYGGFKLPDSVMSIPTSNRILYYNIFTEQYQWSDSGSGSAYYDNPFNAPTEILELHSVKTVDANNNPIPSGVYGSIDNYTNEYCTLLEPSNGNPLVYFTRIGQQNAEDLADGFLNLSIKDYFKIPINSLSSSTSVSFEYGERISYAVDEGTYFSSKAKGCLLFGILERNSTKFKPVYYIQLGGYNYTVLDAFIVDGITIQGTDSSNANCTLIDTSTNNEDFLGDAHWINKAARLTQHGNPTGFDCTISYLEETHNDVIYPTLQFHLVLKSSINDTIIYDNKIKISRYYSSYFSNLTTTQIDNIVTKAKDIVPKLNCVILDNYAVEDTESISQDSYIYNKETVMNPNYYSIPFLTDEGQFHYAEAEAVTDGVYKVCEILPNRGSIYLNEHIAVQSEDIYGTYAISIPNRTFPDKGDGSKGQGSFTGWLDWGRLSNNLNCYENVDTSTTAKFVVPICCAEADDGDRYEVYYNNIRLAYRKGLHRWCNWQSPMNYILLPKGVSNPFNYKLQHSGWNLDSYSLKTTNPSKCSAQKQYNVKISKNIKQKSS